MTMSTIGPVFRGPVDSSSRIPPSQSSISVSSGRSSSCRFRMLNSLGANSANESASQKFDIPIVGYEVIEERARFTVYKLRIQNTSVGDYWFVFRRYTDFVRLYSTIKNHYPDLKVALPRKRWFGDNFDPGFLDERRHGLQRLVNTILNIPVLYTSRVVRDFFCLDEPPSYAESIEESRAIFEALEDTICDLRQQLRERDAEVEKLRLSLSTEVQKRDELFRFVTTSGKKCAGCLSACQKGLGVPGNACHGGGDSRHSVMQLQDITSVLAQLD